MSKVTNLVYSAAAGILSTLRFDAVLALRIRRSRSLAILNLHRVSPNRNAFYGPLHPDVLDEVIRRLKELLPIYSLRDLATTSPKEGGVVLSFDDGYEDFFEHAVPVLAAHNIRANQNIIPETILTQRSVRDIELADYLDAASLQQFRALRLPGFDKQLENDDWTTKARFGAELSHFLKMRPKAERDDLWHIIERWTLSLGTVPLTKPMTLEQLKVIADQHDIGAHSFSHESMGYQSDDYFAADFERCSSFFATHLGKRIEIYAFPNGSYRKTQIALLLEKSVRWILLVENKFASSRGPVLPRINFSPRGRLDAALYATGIRSKGYA
jgi:peptidoglycan/xylan/chitin deacetylase (PgdA/CDA1 family)